MSKQSEVVELTNDILRLRCVPHIGGTVTDFSLRSARLAARSDHPKVGPWVPIMRRNAGTLTRSSHGANFPLAPYSNRLKDGRFVFEGVEYQLDHPEKHAIHGDVRDRPWQVTAHTADRVSMRFDSRSVDAFNFPFPMGAELGYRLEGNTLHTELVITNAGTSPMPVGGGFHPYFHRSLVAGEEVTVAFSATGVYEAGEPPIPESGPVAIGESVSFAKPRILDRTLDHCFAGWDGAVALHWPIAGITAQMLAGPELGHVIVYAPPDETFFAVEPVANANNGFNLCAAGVKGTGVTTLAPGASRALAFSLSISSS